MANYNITKDGERLAGLYQREQVALMALAFGLWRNITDDEMITDDMVAEAITKIAFSDTEL